MNSRVHKRFAAFVVSTGALCICFLIGPEAEFGTFAKTIGFAFSAYVAGQSATDWKNAEPSAR